MRSWLLFTIPLAATLVLVATSCAPRKYVPKADEEFYGTWINDKSINAGLIQKKISNAEGNQDFFGVNDSTPVFEDKQEIDSKWTDSEGNIWYKISGTVSAGRYVGTKWQELDKLSQSATVWEYNFVIVADFDPKYYPTRVDPKDPNYRIFYRLKE